MRNLSGEGWVAGFPTSVSLLDSRVSRLHSVPSHGERVSETLAEEVLG